MATIAYPITAEDSLSVSQKTLNDLDDLINKVSRESKSLHILTWYSSDTMTSFVEITDKD